MQKSFFTLIFILSLTGLVRSQNILEGYWGVKGGVTVNKISQIEFNNSLKPGFQLGLFANFKINKYFSFQHELLYSMRGVALTLNNGTTYRKNFSYIDIPWTFNYYLNKSFYVTAGVQTSIYTYFKTPKYDSVIYNKDNVNPIDFSYLAGATFIADNNIGFGMRFVGSIVPLFDINETINRNYSMQVFLIYAVNKRKGRKF